MATANAILRTPAPAARWILGPRRDLALFVLPALWILPLVFLLDGSIGVGVFGAGLLAIGSVGHHLPGFIRAYTDPGLFRRHRVRFIAAPLFFAAAALAAVLLDLHALTLLLVLWGTWHGAMQVHGFLRIYEAKAGPAHALTARLDRAMCLLWFGAAVLHSSTRMPSLLAVFYGSGGPLISPEAYFAFRTLWDVALAAVTVAFVANAWARRRRGQPASPLKLAVLVTSVAFWWLAMVGVDNLLLGLVLFEIFHDVQYNAIVWAYNRRRIASVNGSNAASVSAGAPERFLFAPGFGRVALYTLLVLGYGILGMLAGYSGTQGASPLPDANGTLGSVSIWTQLFVVSAFLHFYFDGFIWRVRDPDLRQGLGLGASSVAPDNTSSQAGSRGWLPSGLRWGLLFVLPAAALGYSEHRGRAAPLRAQYENIAAIAPANWYVHLVLGAMENLDNNVDAAIAHYAVVTAARPELALPQAQLGNLLLRKGDADAAIPHFTRAAAANPDDAETRGRLGLLLLERGRVGEALPHLQAAAAANPGDAEAAYAAARILLRAREPARAVPLLEQTVRLQPGNKEALNHLGLALQILGDNARAAEYYRAALRLDPRFTDAGDNLRDAEQLLALRETK